MWTENGWIPGHAYVDKEPVGNRKIMFSYTYAGKQMAEKRVLLQTQNLVDK